MCSFAPPPGRRLFAAMRRRLDSRQPRWEGTVGGWSRVPSLVLVFVVTTPPEAILVATEWRPVEPLVHAPEAVQPSRVGRIGVVHDAIVEHECAHAGPFVAVGRP